MIVMGHEKLAERENTSRKLHLLKVSRPNLGLSSPTLLLTRELFVLLEDLSSFTTFLADFIESP